MWAVHHAIVDFTDRERLLGGDVVTYRRDDETVGDVRLEYVLGDVDGRLLLDDDDDGLSFVSMTIILEAGVGAKGQDYNYFRWCFLDYLHRLYRFLNMNNFGASGFGVNSLFLDEGNTFQMHGNIRVGLFNGRGGKYRIMKDGRDLKQG